MQAAHTMTAMALTFIGSHIADRDVGLDFLDFGFLIAHLLTSHNRKYA